MVREILRGRQFEKRHSAGRPGSSDEDVVRVRQVFMRSPKKSISLEFQSYRCPKRQSIEFFGRTCV
jgi:hypothetical protein